MFSKFTVTPPDVEIQKYLTSIHISEWLKDDLFRLRWWVLIVLVLLSQFIWWKRLDKSRLPEVVTYAALAAIVTMGIVEYGEELTLWDYPTDIIPIFPPLTSVNLILLPLSYSLIYQHFTALKGFIMASAAATAGICFIIEPVLARVGLYELLHWKYYLSFPIYLVTAICVRAVVIKMLAINRKHLGKT